MLFVAWPALAWLAGVHAVHGLAQAQAERVWQHCQEWPGHCRLPACPSDWLDWPLAGMRWALQEHDQALQDSWRAALAARSLLAPHWAWPGWAPRMPWLDGAMPPLGGSVCGPAVDAAARAWCAPWAVAGQQRRRR